ncbi:MAG: alpha/beta hydrolase [Planctomyces sp.]|nr:alpha/beta hydrolase [Planctomyces sp.]
MVQCAGSNNLLSDKEIATQAKSTIQLKGVDLSVIRKGSGPQILALHGGDGPIDRFPFADQLAERYEIIQPVHPGFSGTPIPEHFDNLQDLIYLYLDLIDHLDLSDAILMGFSMGGWLAAEIAVINTRRFSKLVLVDSVGIKVGGPFDRDITDLFATPPDDLIKASWHDTSKAPDPKAMADEDLEIFAADRIAHGLYTWEPYMHNPKLPYRLHRIDIPTLLVWGERDGIVTPSYGEAFRDMIPGASMVVIPEAAHSPHVEQPAAFVKHFTEFASR